MKKRNYLMVGVACLTAAGMFIWKDSISAMIKREVPEEVIATRVVRPVPTTFVKEYGAGQVRTFPGTVRAQHRVDLAFSVEGLIQELGVFEGQSFSKGAVLARLDPRDFANSLDASRSRYEESKRGLERAKDLFGRKSLSKAKYDAARVAYDVAAAELRIKEKALADTVIYAPFDGVVAKRYVENYEHVKDKASIISFKDLSMIEVVVQVPERLIAHGGAASFDEITVKFDADGEHWFAAKVKEYSVQSDPVSGTYEVVVALNPPEALQILPGMTASVKVKTEQEMAGDSKRFVVPVGSLLGGNDGRSYVWVIPEQSGNPKRVEVTPGPIHSDGVEILSGLSGKERIATAGIHTLIEDMQVRPMAEGREGLDG